LVTAIVPVGPAFCLLDPRWADEAEVRWLDPWRHVATERADPAAAYEREMQSELGAGHPLFGIPVAAVGKHEGSDDVRFEVLDGSGRVAVVHLTRARHPEPLPWPGTEFFAGLEAFAELRKLEPATA
jgi:hypothetical protein